ncbi:hypothetical protein DB30_00021 [Enhygromyxa salina]|uniref:DUF3501 family protein n=1 Tax=Enhygromyxa salina TaxID=215803 RepID=A0A0C2DIL6_9BACT|nr:DUF3501 family protein [Enhygromyxa salina]KIG19512.1 hypothetical protein DB30_00021 [Enhygromyxa salina]
MKPISRTEILDFVTYTERRDEIRDAALAAKRARRVTVGDVFTFLFESRETVRYQILEMVRVEQIIKEADIQHEIATYNELLGRNGALCATLLIGIADEAERAIKLRAWIGLLDHVYAKTADGGRITPKWDPRQVGVDRLSSVQYLTFELNGCAPIAIGIDWPERDLVVEATLEAQQVAALQADLDQADA